MTKPKGREFLILVSHEIDNWSSFLTIARKKKL